MNLTRLALTSSADTVAQLTSALYPQFFWTAVSPYIGDALRYLSVTQEGKLWVSNLYAHVFSQEHHVRIAQMGHNRDQR